MNQIKYTYGNTMVMLILKLVPTSKFKTDNAILTKFLYHGFFFI